MLLSFDVLIDAISITRIEAQAAFVFIHYLLLLLTSKKSCAGKDEGEKFSEE